MGFFLFFFLHFRENLTREMVFCIANTVEKQVSTLSSSIEKKKFKKNGHQKKRDGLFCESDLAKPGNLADFRNDWPKHSVCTNLRNLAHFAKTPKNGKKGVKQKGRAFLLNFPIRPRENTTWEMAK